VYSQKETEEKPSLARAPRRDKLIMDALFAMRLRRRHCMMMRESLSEAEESNSIAFYQMRGCWERRSSSPDRTNRSRR
jgi:hypothetical protein